MRDISWHRLRLPLRSIQTAYLNPDAFRAAIWSEEDGARYDYNLSAGWQLANGLYGSSLHKTWEQMTAG